MKRVFIGIDISDTEREAISDYVSGLRHDFSTHRVGWERPEKLHLTLKFIGTVEEHSVEGIVGATRGAASSTSAFTATLTGTGCFPPKGDPRILWIGVNDKGQLAELASRVDEQCERLGFEREKRKFSPHLTIARVREPSDARDLARRHTSSEFGPIEVSVSELTVFESKLGPTGSKYERIAAVPLGV